MSIVKSPYILLAKLKARYELEKNRGELGMIIRLRHTKHLEKLKHLQKTYDYIPKKHEQFFSPHAIARTNGCGCAYCTSLHKYAIAKLNLHYLKKSFESEFDMEMFSTPRQNIFSPSNNFYALYSEHSATAKKGEQLSQLEFFNQLRKERKDKLKEYRRDYKSIKEAIHTILSS